MLERTDGGYELDELVGRSVTRISLMGLVRLNFEEPSSFNTPENPEIRLDRGGIRVEFRPYDQNWTPSGMTELAALYGAVVASASTESDATLTITFADNRQLEVLPDPQYEGWGISAAGHLLGQVAGNGLYHFPPAK
jgi:hypothetical protein